MTPIDKAAAVRACSCDPTENTLPTNAASNARFASESFERWRRLPPDKPSADVRYERVGTENPRSNPIQRGDGCNSAVASFSLFLAPVSF